MPTRRFSLKQALRNRKGNQYRRWSGGNPDNPSDDPSYACNRIGVGYLETEAKPEEKLKPSSIYAVGSCFAREIESAFQKTGWPVLSLGDQINDEVFLVDGRPETGFLNRYSAASMALEFERSLGVMELGKTELLNQFDTGAYFDPHFTNSLAPGSLEVVTRRRELTKAQTQQVRHAGLVVLTLGLNEAWYDAEARRYLNVMPRWDLEPSRDRYQVHTFSTRENVEALERIYACLKERTETQPRIVVTVSPVALQTTFMPEDIIVANAEAKATLRAAAAEFCHAHADVSYFQSNEMVMYSGLDDAFRRDRQHVQRGMVGQIVKTFIRDFVEV